MTKTRCTNRALSIANSHKRRRPRYYRLTRDIVTCAVPKSEIERALRYAKASLAIEGQFVSEEAEEIVRKRVEGKITHEEFKKSALAIALKH